ncbi:MAG: PAS domain S-box protein [Draconibacterium sp.]
MEKGMTKILIQNATLLVTLSFLFGVIKWYRPSKEVIYQVINGIWFGLVAIASMMMPYEHSPGIIYDGRSVVMTLAGLWGGGLTTVISAFIAGAYRIYLGGPGVWAGLTTIVLTGITGLVFRLIIRDKIGKQGILGLYLIGVIAHIVMLAAQLLLPNQPFLIIKKVWLPMLTILPVAFVFISKLFQLIDGYINGYKKIAEAEELYREREFWMRESQRVGNIGSYDFDIKNGHWSSSEVLDEIFGITGEYHRSVESWISIVHPDQQKEMLDYLTNWVVKEKHPFEKEYRIIRQNDGEIRWVLGHGELRFNENGEPVRMFGTIQDITERKLFEQQLKDSEERFRKAILSAPIPVMVHDEDGNVINLSEGWTHFSGYTIEDIPTLKVWTQKAYGEKAAEMEAYINSIFKEKETIYSGEFEITTKDGSKRIWNFYTTPIGKSTGKKILLSMGPDVTQRIKIKKELEVSEQSFRELFEGHTAIKLLIHPENSRIVKANKAASNFYGWSIEELENMTLEQINAVSPEVNHETMKNIMSGITKQYEFRHKLANGEIRDVEVFTGKTEYKGEILLYSIIHDITEKKQILNDLVVAKEKAEESEKLKSAFLANMSHEIRTPLNGIVGFTNLLTAVDNPLTNEDKREFARVINKSTEGLLKIIDDILDLSRLESGNVFIEKNPVDVGKILLTTNMIFEKVLANTNKEKLELVLKNVPSPVVIRSDENRLIQIFSNLMDNAMRFTEEGRIEFGVSSLTENYIEFFVSDTGIGIPIEKQQVIFGRFTQADAGTSRKFGGTGLGLAIVKKLIDLMGSEINIESEPGKGSRFSFRLPYVLPKNEHDGLAEENDQKSFKKSGDIDSILKVLVVEDDEVSILYFKHILGNRYENLFFAKTGNEALEMYEKEKPDIILMDIGLPDINGLEVVKRIREKNQVVTIIAQTAFAMYDDIALALDAGCNDYINKPVSREALLKKLNRE